MEETKQQEASGDKSVKEQILSVMRQTKSIMNQAKQEFRQQMNELPMDSYEERRKLYEAHLALIDVANTTLQNKIIEIINQ